jgi:DNA-binding SARP family transcriptional activator/predicted ATPase
MSRIEARLFAKPALQVEGRCVPLAHERPFQLLAYLALRGDWVSRDLAAHLLWPERATPGARANLRFVLVQLRARVPGCRVEATPDLLRWQIATDVGRFEKACAEKDWACAVALYTGELLEGFEARSPAPFVEWLQFERARLGAAWHDAVARRLDQLAADPEARASLAARALAIDPYDETALGHRLRALTQSSRGAEAEREYRGYAERLASELGVEPSAALRETARALRAAPAPPAGPERPAALIGRRFELARIEANLTAPGCRLLTITGPGGVGKSALARAAVERLAPRFEAGAYWIALDDLTDTERVTQRCLDALGAAATGGPVPPLRQLHAQIAARALLLVLDNAEHLPALAPWVQVLLDACPACRVLVTSRSRLALDAEWLLPLEGLPVPDADETEADALRSFDAVRLFEQRVAQVAPDFDAVRAAAGVARLVREVGGLPLAIELAAPWARLMPVDEITFELQRSLRWIDGDRHGRVHNLHDCFEHSWRSLAPAEQKALAALSLGQGSFSREAALALADAPLPLLAALADKSLLRPLEAGRFGFHPLVQQLALEKLDASGERAVAEERFAKHYLRLLARFNSFHSIDQTQALQVISAEFSPALAAWNWAVAHRRVDLLQHCASAMESYLDARGMQRFGAELFDAAAAVLDENAAPHQLACCHIQLARAAFAFRRGEFVRGAAAARAALRAATRLRYAFGIQSSSNSLGVTLLRLGQTAEAAVHLRRVLQRSRAAGDEAATPLYALNLARVELDLGNEAEGERLLEEALEGCRKVGSQVGLQAALNETCRLHLGRGNAAAVMPLAQEGLELCQRTGVLRNLPYFHGCLAEANLQLGHDAQAEEHARLALDALGRGGDRNLEPSCRLVLAALATRSRRFDAALAELKAAARAAAESSRAQAYVVTEYARWCAAMGKRQAAAAALRAVTGSSATPSPLRSTAAGELAALGEAHAAEVAPDLAAALARLLAEPPAV